MICGWLADSAKYPECRVNLLNLLYTLVDLLYIKYNNYIYIQIIYIYLKDPSGHVICTILHPWQPSLLYKMEGLNPWACAFDFVQQACPTPAGAHPAYQRYLSTLHLCPFSPLPRLGHHRPPSLLYKMGWPNPWACVSDFVQQACPTQASTPARPSHIHQVPPHPAYQRYPSTLHLCPLSHLPSLGHHWPPSLLYKMGVPNPWACVSDFVQQACPTPANTPARPSHMHQVPPHPTCQSYPSTLHLCPLSHLPTLGHHWPPSLLYKMGMPTLGIVPLILYSRTVPHQEVHQPNPVTSTKFRLSIILLQPTA